MAVAICVYLFMAAATAVALCKGENTSEIIASVLIGFVWPFFLVVKAIQKLAL